MLSYYQLNPKEQTSVKSRSKYNNFYSRKSWRKCRLKKWQPSCLGLNMLTSDSRLEFRCLVCLVITLENITFIEQEILYDAMMTSSNGNIFRVTDSLWGEFAGHRWVPLTKASNADLWCFFYLRLHKWLNKQSRRQWFKPPLWYHR